MRKLLILISSLIGFCLFLIVLPFVMDVQAAERERERIQKENCRNTCIENEHLNKTALLIRFNFYNGCS